MGSLGRAVALATVVVTWSGAAAASVQVQRRGDRLDVEAHNAPLADILAELARQTGMKVVYEGPPPRNALTATLKDRSQPEAVLALFEGLGLNFALSLDTTGTRVDTLLVVGSSGSGRTAPLQAPLPAARRPALPPEDPAAEGEPEEPPPLDEPAAQEPDAEPQQPAPTAPVLRPLMPPSRPGSAFELRPAPLMFPTPSPPPTQPEPGEPAPEPTPTPTPPVR